MQTVFEKLTEFVRRIFKTGIDIFLEALQLSPNAQGYVLGSITELLLKKRIEELGFEVKRIREKWEGRKHSRHHGDFYFRRPSALNWFVLESKGVKSNSEKWHKLYRYENLKRFLVEHSNKIFWVNQREDVEPQVEAWIRSHLPRFFSEYADNLYEYEEVQSYLKNAPKRETVKFKAISNLKHLSREQITALIEERLGYVMTKLKVLETHFVSGVSECSERTQATPRKDEFNIVAVDIVLRYHEHKFLFANPQHLDSSGSDPNHLQQNYIIGFVFVDEGGSARLSITDEWNADFCEVFSSVDSAACVNEVDMQIDNRYIVIDDPNE